MSLVVLGVLAVAATRGIPATRASLAVCPDSMAVAYDPSPRMGSLFRVRVRGGNRATTLSGTASGEPLHFFMGADSVAVAIAAVPVDGDTLVRVVIRCEADGRVDSLVRLPVAARADYPMERLTVAPAFGRPPDSALAARITRESARALDVARLSHRTPRQWLEPFIAPRASRITSGFGSGREFNGTITSRHMGTDFAGTTGAPVLAANRGVVRIVDAFYYGGNVIYVDHGDGLSTAYLHLSRQLVQVGDTVERGQRIGLVGATGRVTGPHLHLIVRYGAVTVDAQSLLRVLGEDRTVR